MHCDGWKQSRNVFPPSVKILVTPVDLARENITTVLELACSGYGLGLQALRNIGTWSSDACGLRVVIPTYFKYRIKIKVFSRKFQAVLMFMRISVLILTFYSVSFG